MHYFSKKSDLHRKLIILNPFQAEKRLPSKESVVRD